MSREYVPAEFLEIAGAELEAGTPLAFDLYTWVMKPGVRRLFRIHAAGDPLPAERLAQYDARGLHFLFTPAESAAALGALHAARKNATPRIARGMLLSLIAPALPGESGERTNPCLDPAEALSQAWRHCARLIRRIAAEAPPLPPELATLAETDAAAPDHGARVATLAVIFAMAFEQRDPRLLADIARAGLLHDLGEKDLPAECFAAPITQLAPGPAQLYKTHVEKSDPLLAQHVPPLSARALALVRQHHERFDGSGYPGGLEGFQIDDLSQLLGVADLLDDLMSGRWDGKQRGVTDAFSALQGVEGEHHFPQFFNPDLLCTLTEWVRRSTLGEPAAPAQDPGAIGL